MSFAGNFFEEPLVVFCTVEKEDAKNTENIVKQAFREIKEIADKLKPSHSGNGRGSFTLFYFKFLICNDFSKGREILKHFIV